MSALQASLRSLRGVKVFRYPAKRALNHHLSTRLFAANAKVEQDGEQQVNTPETSASSSSKEQSETGENEDLQKPGAIGGFMRGLIGGQAVAVEDAFIAEAKEQGVKIPPPPPPRRSELVPVKRRRRREDEADGEQTIRDRIFGRFSGSAFMQGAMDAKDRIAERIDESDNPIVNFFRNVYDRLFAENEMGMVIREIREEDPDFRVSEFLKEVETQLVPKILSAYLNGDRDAMKGFCTDEAYAMLNASIRERETEGIVMDTNILDISEIDLTAGRLLEDSPVLIVTFNTQQINCLRDKGGNIVEGQEDDIRAVYYAWAFVREAEYEEDKPSGGGVGDDREAEQEDNEDGKDRAEKEEPQKPWKLMEMAIRGAHSTI